MFSGELARTREPGTRRSPASRPWIRAPRHPIHVASLHAALWNQGPRQSAHQCRRRAGLGTRLGGDRLQEAATIGTPTRCAAGPGASWHGRGRIRDVGGTRRRAAGDPAACRAEGIGESHGRARRLPASRRRTGRPCFKPTGSYGGCRCLHHGGLDAYEPDCVLHARRVRLVQSSRADSGRHAASQRPLHAATGPHARLRRPPATRTTPGVDLRPRLWRYSSACTSRGCGGGSPRTPAAALCHRRTFRRVRARGSRRRRGDASCRCSGGHPST